MLIASAGAWLHGPLLAATISASAPVRWSAPDECPSAETVHAAIVRTLASEPGDVLEVSAGVRSSEQGWELSVVVMRSSGEFRRDLHVDSCEAAAEAAPLVVGLLASQSPDSASESAPGPAPEPAPGAPPPKPPAASTSVPEGALDSAPKPQPPDKTPQRRWDANLGVSGGYAIGGLGPGGEFVGRVMLGRTGFRLGVRVGHQIRRRVRLESPPDTGANLSAVSAGPAASWRWSFNRLAWLVAAALPVGGIRARGIGGTSRETRWVPWPAVVAGTGLQWDLSQRLSFRAEVEARLALLRHDFEFDGRGLRTTGSAAGAILAGPTVRFWP